MNLTMLPLEDTLVEEITEHENGLCTAQHSLLPELPECTQNAGAVFYARCACVSGLVCSAVAAWAQAGAEAGLPCNSCWNLVADCWSVVMLP